MINIDLYGDWIRLLAAELRAQGYEVGDAEEPLTIAIKCFNVRQRSLGQLPRRVHRGSSLADFPEHAAALDNIQRIAEQGGDLRPYVSRRLLDVNYHDPLLNDWGLHHMHLGEGLAGDGFVERSGPLLFVRANKTELYMGAIKEHGAWTDEDLLEEVLENWPELLKPCETSLPPSQYELTPSERQQARKANLNTPTTLSNGKTYITLGGGVSSAGSNVRFLRWHDDVAEFLEWMESEIRHNIEDLRSRLPEGKQFGQPPTFRLQMQDDRAIAGETTACWGFAYKFPWFQ